MTRLKAARAYRANKAHVGGPTSVADWMTVYAKNGWAVHAYEAHRGRRGTRRRLSDSRSLTDRDLGG